MRWAAGPAAVAAIVATTAAGAASPDACRRYADDASAQFARLRATAGCRQGAGNLWHGDRTRHYAWCLTAAPAALRRQLALRDEAIARCDPSYGD